MPQRIVASSMVCILSQPYSENGTNATTQKTQCHLWGLNLSIRVTLQASLLLEY